MNFVAVAIEGEGLRGLGLRIEGNEADEPLGRLARRRLGRRANGGIDQVLVALGTRQRGKRQHARAIEAGHGDDVGNLQCVAGQGSGLVGAQHIHGGGFMRGRKPRQKHAARREDLGAQGRREREGRRQRQRDGGEQGGERETDLVGSGHCRDIGVNDNERGHRAIDDGEIARHAENCGLLRAGGAGDAHQFGRTAEIRLGSGRRHLGDGLAAAHQRAGVDLAAEAGIGRKRFPGEHRLVDHDRSRHEGRIGRNQSTERQPDGIAGNEFCRRHAPPFAVAAHQGGRRKPPFERSQAPRPRGLPE